MEGKVALVTGGASGIGLAIVSRLLREGARVAFFSRSQSKVDDACSRLSEYSGNDRLHAVAADVTSHREIENLCRYLLRKWSSIDILVNNAGISPKKKASESWISSISLDEWKQVIEVNLTGAFVCTRAVYESMVERRYGRIINISSLAGRTIPLIAGPHYAASKAGIIGFMRSLSRDLASYGITVNCVAPGRILSEMTGHPEAEVNRSALSRIPMGRLGLPEEVASVVAFLASQQAGFITGATIDVNGGEFGA